MATASHTPTARQAKRAGPKLEAGPEASAELSEGTIEARRGRDTVGGSMRQHESAPGHLPEGWGRPEDFHEIPMDCNCPRHRHNGVHHGLTRTAGRRSAGPSQRVAATGTAWREGRTRFRARTGMRSAPALPQEQSTSRVAAGALARRSATDGPAALEALVMQAGLRMRMDRLAALHGEVRR